MFPSEPDHTVTIVRDLLAQKRNKDLIVAVLQKRGMAEEDARELVHSIYKENLSANRRSSLGFLFGGGAGAFISLGIFLLSDRPQYYWLPICALAFFCFVWGLIKFLTASGYEVEPDSGLSLDDF